MSVYEKTQLRLVQTYILADKLGDILTTNMIIARIMGLSDIKVELPGPDATRIVSTRTTPETPLRKLFIDYYVHESGMKSLRKILGDEHVSRAFICEVLDEKARLCIENPGLKICDVFKDGFT